MLEIWILLYWNYFFVQLKVRFLCSWSTVKYIAPFFPVLFWDTF